MNLTYNLRNHKKIVIEGEKIISNNPLITVDDITDFVTDVNDLARQNINEESSNLLNTVKEIQLSSLNLSDWDFSIFAPCILKLKQLEKLDLSNNRLSNDSAIILAECLRYIHNLKSLNVANNKLEVDGGVKIIDEFLKIQKKKEKEKEEREKLNDKTHIRKQQVAKYNNKSRNDQCSTNVKESKLHNSSDSFDIDELDLSDNFLELYFILKLTTYLENVRLRKAVLRNIGVNDIGISSFFKSCKYIQVLDLSENEIQMDLFPHYIDSLFNIQMNLKELYLSDICKKYNHTKKSKNGNTVLLALIPHLHKAQNLTIFAFANNGVTDEAFSQFCNFLKKSENTIREIDFSNNNISNLDDLNEALKENGILRVINLGHNEMKDADVKLFCNETLSSNLEIHELILSNNHLSNTTCELIASALRAQAILIKKKWLLQNGSFSKLINEKFGETNSFMDFTPPFSQKKEKTVSNHCINSHPSNGDNKKGGSIDTFSDASRDCSEECTQKYSKQDMEMKKNIFNLILERHKEDHNFFSCMEINQYNRATDMCKKLYLQELRRKEIYNKNEEFLQEEKENSLFPLHCFKGLKFLNMSGTIITNEGIEFFLNSLRYHCNPLEFLDISCCEHVTDSIFQTISNFICSKKSKFLKNTELPFKHLPLSVRGMPPIFIPLDGSDENSDKNSIESSWWITTKDDE